MKNKCQHRFVAFPITGMGMGNGHEAMLGWKVECDKCHNKPKKGDKVVEIKASWWKELIPKDIPVDIVCDGNL